MARRPECCPDGGRTVSCGLRSVNLISCLGYVHAGGDRLIASDAHPKSATAAAAQRGPGQYHWPQALASKLLGERAQAKSRLVRGLTALLDEETPVVKGAEIAESPFRAVTGKGRTIVAEAGNETPVSWLPRAERDGGKLATV